MKHDLELYLTRLAYFDDGILGRLYIPSHPPLWTIERPWKDNALFISCIPPGSYELQPTTFRRGQYETVELLDVPGRSRILIHKGNTPEDVQGCIAVGETASFVSERPPQIFNSSGAFETFTKAVVEEEWLTGTIEVCNCMPDMVIRDAK